MRVLVFLLLLGASMGAQAALFPVIEVDAATFEGLPRIEVKAAAHDQPASSWSGVSLAAVLARAGAPLGDKLRGPALAQVVRVTASDGYQVVFSLAELDPALGNLQVLLVDRQDGKPLSAKDGPWRLVVASDKRPARWVRNVVRIERLAFTGKQ